MADKNGFYNIYINSRLSDVEQQRALRHELIHIRRDDFEKADADITVIENIV